MPSTEPRKEMLVVDDEPNVLKSVTRLLRKDGIVCHTAQGGQEGEEIFRRNRTGYPDGLVKEEIPFPVRIVSVVDVYDALTHERPYKEAWRREKAIEEIVSLSGKAFDPAVVDAFLTVVDCP